MTADPKELEKADAEEEEEEARESPFTSPSSPPAEEGESGAGAGTKTMSHSLAPCPLKTGPGRTCLCRCCSDPLLPEEVGTLQRRSVRSSEAEASSRELCFFSSFFSSVFSSESRVPARSGAHATRWIDPSWPDSLNSTGQEETGEEAEEGEEGEEEEGDEILIFQIKTSRKTEPPATQNSVSSSFSFASRAME